MLNLTMKVKIEERILIIFLNVIKSKEIVFNSKILQELFEDVKKSKKKNIIKTLKKILDLEDMNKLILISNTT